ncbi:cytochrome P450, partial [Lasiosphaeris hirsuta]
AVAIDVITEYAYARCWNLLDTPDYGNWYPEAIRSVQTMFPWLQTFPSLIPLFRCIPESIKVVIFPAYKRWNNSLKAVRVAVKEVRRELAHNIYPPRRTIIHDLIDPPSSAFETQSSKDRIILSDAAVFADAVNVTGAGTETTGATKERAVFEVINNPQVYAALASELRDAFPDPSNMRLAALEKLPVLTGVIKEALRLNPGVPGRLPRIVPAGGVTFNDIYLPQGTVVNMSAWDMHHDTRVFTSPRLFDPSRWIAKSEDGSLVEEVRERERYLVAFSKGSRGCVGQSLAMCELYCTLAALFRRFDDLSLRVSRDFTMEDMEMTELVLGYHPNKRRFRVYREGNSVLSVD